MKDQSGFTLIELMVVIAVVSILSSVASVTYSDFHSKAMQTEAKLALSNAFIAYQAYYHEHGTYSSCFRDVVKSTDNVRYYSTGFSGSGGGNFSCGASADRECNRSYFSSQAALDRPCSVANAYYIRANAGANPPYNGDLTTATNANDPGIVSANLFTFGAAGDVGDPSVYDVWTMSQDKKLLNTVYGI